MEIGIIGLPNVGKSSLFNLLTKAAAQTGNFPFTTIEPNVGIAAVTDDKRLRKLGEIYNPEKLTPATVRFVDVAGLVKNAHKGEGLGNTFLSHIRPLDAAAHVLREFVSADVVPSGAAGPDDERMIVDTELLLADLDYATRAREKLIAASRSGDKSAAEAVAFLEAVIARLKKGEAVAGMVPPPLGSSSPFHFKDFLTAKPRFFVLNSTAPFEGAGPAGAVRIDVKLETESLELPADERAGFLAECGISRPASENITAEAARLLELITFYTVVGTEVRARHIKRGSTALDAAAGIHTDMAKGFIKAEVLSFDALAAAGSEKDARARGFVRAEGRDYPVADGDIVRIHFRV
jgi:hypothetical protein